MSFGYYIYIYIYIYVCVWGGGVQKFDKVIMPCVIPEAEEANAVPRRPYPRTARLERRATATSMARY